MSVSINKETKIYCSFSKNAGNKGCEFFNAEFSKHGINAIYKSFSIVNIYKAIEAAKTLKFSGCAVAMPYKIQVMNVLNFKDDSVVKSDAVNTIIFDWDTNKLTGYNTDYYGTKKILSSKRNDYNEICILGNGGLSGAVQAASIDLGFKINVITRTDWHLVDKIKNSLIYNCTPLSLKPDNSNCYVDCLIGT